MNYLSKHWQGNLSIAKSFWLSGLISSLMLFPVSLCFMILANHIGIGELFAIFKSGKGFVLRSPPSYFQAIEKLLELASFVWWSVGLWRSCNNPENNNKAISKHLIIKAFVLFSAATEIYALLLFVAMASGFYSVSTQDNNAVLEFEAKELKSQLASCWDLPDNLTKAQQIPVEVLITVNPDRTISEAHVVDDKRLSKDLEFKARAESALNALKKDQCRRLNLPGDGYESWKQIDFTFDPR